MAVPVAAAIATSPRVTEAATKILAPEKGTNWTVVLIVGVIAIGSIYMIGKSMDTLKGMMPNFGGFMGSSSGGGSGGLFGMLGNLLP